MSPKITFYIVRHGKTILNTLGRVQGWSDSPLTQEEGSKIFGKEKGRIKKMTRKLISK
ncbi:MAG: phosphoglycerate mutase family protein [Flavobacteriaceae bacterium]|jgi:bisphosphoglycerate-dependent phosphoglycerate mutase|nr:phosphoglycerate mutase family protein [Flavobacteriaceae bacterium]